MRLWLGRLLRLLWPLVLLRATMLFAARLYADDFYILLGIVAFILMGLLIGLIDLIQRRRPTTLLSILLIPGYFAWQIAFPAVMGDVIESGMIASDELFLAIDPDHFAACRQRAASPGVAICRHWADIGGGDVVFYDAQDQILLNPAQRTATWKKSVEVLDDAPFTEAGYEVHPLGGHFYRVFFSYDWPATPL